MTPQIRERLSQVLAEAEARYGLPVHRVHVSYNLRARAVGRARYDARTGRMEIELNRAAIVQIPGHIVANTIPHEVAHLVCMFHGTDRGHGAEWKRVCRALGGNAERLCAAPVTLAKARRTRVYLYRLPSGTIAEVTSRRHADIQRGRIRLRHRETGEVYAAEAFTGRSVLK